MTKKQEEFFTWLMGKGAEIGMSDKEKIDVLMEKLADLYEIQFYSKEENVVLEYKISITESRLNAMGVTDFSGLKPKKKKTE